MARTDTLDAGKGWSGLADAVPPVPLHLGPRDFRWIESPDGTGKVRLVLKEIDRQGIAYVVDFRCENRDQARRLLETAAAEARAAGARTIRAGFRPFLSCAFLPEDPPPGWHPVGTFHMMALRLDASPPPAILSGPPAMPGLAFRSFLDHPDLYPELHNRCFEGVFNAARCLPGERDELLAGIREEREEAAAALLDEEPCGFYRMSLPDGNRSVLLDSLGVLPERRQRGIGRCILAESLRKARDRGARVVRLMVADRNTGALALYRSAGFVEERAYSHYFEPDGPEPDPTTGERLAIARNRLCTVSSLAEDLAALGVRPGMVLEVHVSLRRLGWVCGGAEALIRALLAVLGPEGTLVMATQSGGNSEPSRWVSPPVPEAWWPEIRAEMPPYDPATTPTRGVGVVAECFRSWPGVRRSRHPAASMGALGPAADRIAGSQPLSFPLGEGSPCAALYDLDAHVLLLGVRYDRCTSLHLAEYRAGDRPTIGQGAAMTVDGQRTWVTYRDLDLDSDRFAEPGRLLEAEGRIAMGRVGAAEARLFRVRDAVDLAVRTWKMDDAEGKAP